MQRSKFPYTARSSAKVIRHAVSIDERRAKFRQDLISQEKPNGIHHYRRHHRKVQPYNSLDEKSTLTIEDGVNPRGRKRSISRDRRDTLAVPERYYDRSETSGVRNLSPGYSDRTGPTSRASSLSNLSFEAIQDFRTSSSDDDEQDIQEVWFAGCHAVGRLR